MTPNAAKNIVLASSPMLGGTAGQNLVQTTEVIYRTQSVQRNVASMSMEMNKVGPDWASGRTACVPDSQPSSIVPFSSIRQQLSPAPCSTPDSCDRSMAALFGTIPDKAESGSVSAGRNGETGEIFPTREDNDAPESNMKPVANKSNGQETTVKPKAVTFTASQPSPGGERYHPQNGASSQSVETEKPRTRANRRTYSKIRQSGASTSVRPQPQHASPAVSRNSSHLDNLGPIRIKKTKHSYESTPKGAQAVPEYLERKTSPAKLASGSSRPGSINENQRNQKPPGRMARGRRARGARYNARFNKEN
ncbi:uncharacterized protein BDW47DRAFT_102854 [Aspergillus candidus]|uniref:Uncharacterized protein n=1 Tax=Aspergillus candidus TaxID=41067 RepID=A0A2I2FGA5_ASPCN|nr:hypothetical protein BDW47DRAFT_102854 [Aspergillus candidus]PLB39649.1 hypothetical protein BDW47DRAFT_102854 [Aspergillus candidus]